MMFGNTSMCLLAAYEQWIFKEETEGSLCMLIHNHNSQSRKEILCFDIQTNNLWGTAFWIFGLDPWTLKSNNRLLCSASSGYTSVPAREMGFYNLGCIVVNISKRGFCQFDPQSVLWHSMSMLVVQWTIWVFFAVKKKKNWYFLIQWSLDSITSIMR